MRGPLGGWVREGQGRLAELVRRLEAPTWILIVLIYGGWLALTWAWNYLPLWLAFPLAAWLSAWHMSLQHELIHGHPTRSQRLNDALAWPPLNLWLPYACYRTQHLRHHRRAHLTDPLEDPESNYLTAAEWASAGAACRFLHVACNTLLGRLLLGPARGAARFWRREAVTGDRRVWLGHAVGVGLVLFWVSGVCRIAPLMYVACFVYPGTALTMVRSLAEHRAAARPEDRTATVESGGLLGLLFLFNNLHVLHHEYPGLAWYELPKRWRDERPHWLSAQRGPRYRGYFDVAVRYALRPADAGRKEGVLF